MNIMDLDEAEGLTVEMVRGYLERTGWRNPIKPISQERSLLWVKDVGSGTYRVREDDKAHTVACVADVERRSPQAILREMNPRMRKGMPPEDIQRAHWSAGGLWLASVPDNPDHNGAIIVVSFPDPDMADGHPQKIAIWSDEDWHDGPHLEDCAEWSFWPVDAHGNKLRYPKVPHA